MINNTNLLEGNVQSDLREITVFSTAMKVMQCCPLHHYSQGIVATDFNVPSTALRHLRTHAGIVKLASSLSFSLSLSCTHIDTELTTIKNILFPLSLPQIFITHIDTGINRINPILHKYKS